MPYSEKSASFSAMGVPASPGMAVIPAEAAVEEKPLRELVQQKGWRAGPYFTDICARERQTEQEERA